MLFFFRNKNLYCANYHLYKNLFRLAWEIAGFYRSRSKFASRSIFGLYIKMHVHRKVELNPVLLCFLNSYRAFSQGVTCAILFF